MIDLDDLYIKLTQEEVDILKGAQGLVMAKVMQAVIMYAEAMRADRLADIQGQGHFVIAWSSPGIAPPIEMLEELVAAGLKSKYPFTLDPRPPFDFDNLNLTIEDQEAILHLYKDQSRYDELMIDLGLRDEDAYTCNPYQPEVGNIPKPGTVLAWSESACAIYANSVLGARTIRNAAIMDLLSNIVGKTPFIGLITDQGRKANWLVDVRAEELPNPQLLGAAIGGKVQVGVPYITGLERFLGVGIHDGNIDYFQEMGAIIATYSAIDLYHVENLTPEAVAQNRQLLLTDHSTCSITSEDLLRYQATYPDLWSESHAKPIKCFIGCPHLSLRQLNWWADKLHATLRARDQEKLSVETIICAAPGILNKFRTDQIRYSRLINSGVKLSPTCSETIFETGLSTGKPIVTNSNKLRAYTSARFYPDEQLVDILVGSDQGGATQSE